MGTGSTMKMWTVIRGINLDHSVYPEIVLLSHFTSTSELSLHPIDASPT
jgi:hypothetical protein